MGAPTVTTRVYPEHAKMDDGFRTFIVFANKPELAIWERSVQPPGFDGGAMVETQTMHNVEWRTMATRFLKTLTEGQCKFGYSPAALSSILAMINVNQSITIRFPNYSHYAFWGALTKFIPDALEEGKFPEASATVSPTNTDDSGAEQGPVYLAASGTGTYD